MKNKIIAAGCLIMMLISCISEKHRLDQAGTPLYVYNFGLEHLGMGSQTRLIDSLGYKGFAWPGFWMGYTDSLDSFYHLPEVKAGRLKILGVFFFYNLDENWDSLWLATLPGMARYRIPLWPIFYSQRPDSIELLKNKLHLMCDSANRFGMDVILYPHDGSLIESCREALPYIRSLGKNNLYLSFHLCHELRAGNEKRMEADFRDALPWIKFVTISGADTVHCKRCPDWSQDIRPLDEGLYDTRQYYRMLKNTGYKGPVVLQTYGIQQDPKEHLARSMRVWNSYLREEQ